LFFAAIPLFTTQFAHAGATLSLDEAATRILFNDDQTLVSLAFENPAGHSAEARIRLELIDPTDVVKATAERHETLASGRSNLKIPIPIDFSISNQGDRNELLWYRMRYHISSASAAGASFPNIEGIVSISEITPDIFELGVSTATAVRPGVPCRVHVSALHPISSRPVTGVNVEATIKFWVDDEESAIRATGVTDADGLTKFDFDLPRNMDRDEDAVDLEITARRGEFKQEAEDEIELDVKERVLIFTDKPLYQPGQTLHMRALVFSSSNRALANEEATFTIKDQEGSVVFSSATTTSRFGACNTEWKIPENVRLGDYRIQLETETSDSDSDNEQTVKISRYDLPNFTVNPKPDQAYYLSGQQAEVEIRASYLFGQPVKRGHVRVVRETEREWSYQEQKWITEEGDKYEGETDSEGRFIARINLQNDHDELAKEDYKRFHDLTYAAYFTDPTTNRTEQRRFDLRITRDAIHIYIVDEGLPQAPDFPLEFYLSTYYADGTPVDCDIDIQHIVSKSSGNASQSGAQTEALRTIRTNRYGLAKVSGLSLPTSEDSGDHATLRFVAHDRNGKRGHQTNSFWLSEYPVIRVETDKIIYRPGEKITAQVTASEPNMRAVVNVLQRGVSLQSHSLQLRSGRASITIPPNRDLKDEVTIVAYPVSTSRYGRYDLPVGSRTVMFPRESDLKLAVQLDQQTYRPGQDAVADVTVRTPEGAGLESALGVVVFDRAVEERTRTDSEFKGAYGFKYANGLLYSGGELSGVSLRELKRLDASKPLPRDLELVAEMLLNGGSFRPNVFGSAEYRTDQQQIFAASLDTRTRKFKDILAARFIKEMEYPTDEDSLRAILAGGGVQLNDFRDPWQMSYRTEFSSEREQDRLFLQSSGPDKRFGTSDDFTAAKMSWPYFIRTGEVINSIVEKYHSRTGKYIRDESTLKEELAREGLDVSRILDRWGNTYTFKFGINGYYYTVGIRSRGPNGKLETPGQETSDDFDVWNINTDYFVEKRPLLESAIADFFKSTGRFPQDETEFAQALSGTVLEKDGFLDPWGERYYVTFSNESWAGNVFFQSSNYSYSALTSKGVTPSPRIRYFNYMRVHSRGADGIARTSDDFGLAGYSQQEAKEAGSRRLNQNASHQLQPGSTGAVTGTIVDPNGAVVAGATVKAVCVNVAHGEENRSDAKCQFEHEVTTNDEGLYLLRNLPVGFYKIEISSPGFALFVMEMVPVKSSRVTRVDSTLNVAGTSMSVEVTANAFVLNTLSQTSTSYGTEFGKSTGTALVASQKSTPRLREYFPETLVWQPALETDVEGRARLTFKLADNITTWKMAVISSTVDGEIGIAEKEIRAFQPFFVEHDPPRMLTEGDQIQLPVVLRNYLEEAQTVDIEIKPEGWFTLLGPAQQREAVASGDASKTIFSFRASSSVKDGKQRITASSSAASDAIEKPVSVHPDGKEVTLANSYLMTDSATLNVNFPNDVIERSTRANMKIYPNLMAHVIESIEGIMQRPYGCGEQTISSTYPSLLALRAYKRSGVANSTQGKALRYLQEGYDRLINYRTADGGFSYWANDKADLALTGYALRFLNDAKEFITVDEELIRSTREWIIKQQRVDGTWPAKYWSSDKDTRQTQALTAYIARVLATTARKAAAAGGRQPDEMRPTPLTLALDYLRQRANQNNDPYLLSAYVLASLDANERTRAAEAIGLIHALRKDENSMTSWSSESGTPFHGWGRTERIETTALVVQALRMFDQAEGVPAASATNTTIADQGVLYLLDNKDRYGVWHSTQATVNVLDALVSTLNGQNASGGSTANLNRRPDDDVAEILVNGRHATTVTLPPPNLVTGPMQLDISQFLSERSNSVSIRRANVKGQAAIQMIQTYYVPWNSASVNQSTNAAASALRLAVSYNKTETEVGAEVTCKVEAQRINTRGYGMLLAEIGLPPGADVDRESLEKAVNESQWALRQYDVLPDRVIVYLWPRSGGSHFEFKFRPRFGLTAKTAPSLLYDYYNPDARTDLAPTRFVVR
jgi:hypothetical protein